MLNERQQKIENYLNQAINNRAIPEETLEQYDSEDAIYNWKGTIEMIDEEMQIEDEIINYENVLMYFCECSDFGIYD